MRGILCRGSQADLEIPNYWEFGIGYAVALRARRAIDARGSPRIPLSVTLATSAVWHRELSEACEARHEPPADPVES